MSPDARPVPRLSSLVVELDEAAKAAKLCEHYADDCRKAWLEAEADTYIAQQRYRRAVYQYETWRAQADPT